MRSAQQAAPTAPPSCLPSCWVCATCLLTPHFFRLLTAWKLEDNMQLSASHCCTACGAAALHRSTLQKGELQLVKNYSLSMLRIPSCITAQRPAAKNFALNIFRQHFPPTNPQFCFMLFKHFILFYNDRLDYEVLVYRDVLRGKLLHKNKIRRHELLPFINFFIFYSLRGI